MGVSFALGGGIGGKVGRRWLQGFVADGMSIRLAGDRFSLRSDEDVLYELWYQYTDILYPAATHCPLPILFHEGPYGSTQCHLKSGDVVLDVGANMGVFSILASKIAKMVIAFEPLESARSLLQDNIRLNEAGNITVIPAAVSNASGSAALQNPGGIGTARFASLADEGGSTPSAIVPVTTVDETVTSLGLSSVDFMKMDIEGAEPLALQGAAETISRFKPHLSICTYHDPAQPAAIRDIVSTIDADYRFEQTPFKLHAYLASKVD